MQKYKNKTVFYDGKVFDSKKERDRYKELTILSKAGEITDLQTQVKFELIPAHYETYERTGKNGKRLRDGRRLIEKAVYYIADFVYKEKDGAVIVEDTKGYKTKDYIIKRKIMFDRYRIRIREI